ncbi:MAG: AsnC family transcriptional regulator, partial [Pseudomonadota bacterium]
MSNSEDIILDDIDKGVLNEIQSDFPIEARPYLALGKRLGLTEEAALSRVNSLRDRGVIRRIGGNFSSGGVGYTSTLCAARVPEDRLEAFAQAVNVYSGVTHNYRRNHDLNVWFTFIAPSMVDIETCLAEISRRTGVDEIYNLP